MRPTAAALLVLLLQLVVWAAALLCAACSSATADVPRCVTIYRGPDLGEPRRPYFATVRCAGAPEVILCRSPRPLPNHDCRPDPAEDEPHELEPDR